MTSLICSNPISKKSFPPFFNKYELFLITSLIREYPFGVLLTHGSNGLDANHLPFELQANEGNFGVLHAHVSRINPVWQDIKNGDEVLVVFQAGDAYISPNWYPSKHEQHRQVPTWNYRVVHAYGKVTIRDDERFVRGVVARLTRTHEASQPEPWKMSDAPKDYLEPMLKAIVGLEIEITKLRGKSKLGQNKEHRDILGAANGLSKSGHQTIADAMYSVAELNK